MSYEDSFEREARDESEFEGSETAYIFSNMRPPNVGIWEWRLVFRKIVLHDTLSDAAEDARSMAAELQQTVVLKKSTYFSAEPDDYGSLSFSENIYSRRRLHFLRLLVVHGKYPVEQITSGERYGARRHYEDEVKHSHHQFISDYAALSEDEKTDFDRGTFIRPFPDGFWTKSSYEPAPDADKSIRQTDRRRPQ